MFSDIKCNDILTRYIEGGDMMYEAVILAAGYSSRVGSNKMLLAIDKKPIICHVIDAFSPICHKIHVVSGHYHDDLTSLLANNEKVNLVYNKDYSLGMFSSLLCGIKHVSGPCFICPGDYPLLETHDILQLTQGVGDFIVPTYQGKRGHPVLLTYEIIQELRKEPIESNLKEFRDRHSVEYIEVKNDGVLIDVDTLDTYQTLIQRKE